MSLNNQPAGEQWLTKAAMPESPLVSFAKQVYPLSIEAQTYANQKTVYYRARKGEMLVTAGEVCSYIYLLQKGIVRGFAKEGTKEITTWITAEGDLVSSITSFDLQVPAQENVHAIEECDLVGLHYDDLQYLYDHYHEVNIVGRKVLERYYRDAEERAYIARLTEATSKYKHFIATKSNLLNRVPLKYIASYLGMTLETLSRIRSKLSQAKQQ